MNRKWHLGLLIALPVLGSGLATAQTFTLGAVSGAEIREYCSAVWLDRQAPDRRLYSACQQEQQQALLRLQVMDNLYSGEDFFRSTALSHCRRESAQGNSLNLLELSFCLDDEIDGYRTIQALRRHYGSRRVDQEAREALAIAGSWSAAASLRKRNAGLKTVRDGGNG
ncbi:MAG: hypothetical protein KDI29_17045 [Pseudomonadales bacterium]|nr:hypothetical protein [Pseudomonadales bacterium]